MSTRYPLPIGRHDDSEWTFMADPKRNCVDLPTRLFFDGTARATAVCQDCPVIKPCLHFALKHHERGVWGGTSERQRRRMRLP
jgi:WhiB family redox-sensing transcriptional regulator